MVSEQWLSLANFAQSITIAISLAAYLPQWMTLRRKRSSENISLSSWSLWLVSSLCSLSYAATQLLVYGTGQVLVVTSVLSVLFIAVTLGLIFLYSPKRDLSAPTADLAKLRAILESQNDAEKALRKLHQDGPVRAHFAARFEDEFQRAQ